MSIGSLGSFNPSNYMSQGGIGSGGGMEQEAAQAKADQIQGARELNDAKRDSYKKATIQARQ